MIAVRWSVGLAAGAVLVASPLAAQVRTIDLGPAGATQTACASDSGLESALTIFNRPATMRVLGGTARIPPNDTIRGSYGVFRGAVLIGGTVLGDLVVLNGDVRISTEGTVTGGVTVLGGRLTTDSGAKIGGARFECDTAVALVVNAQGTLARRPQVRSLGARASAIGFDAGPIRVAPHLGIGEYNRVEGLPIDVGANGTLPVNGSDTATAEVYAVLRTVRDQNHTRPAVGWQAQAAYAHHGAVPYRFGIEGGSTVVATVDRPFGALESGLAAFLFRRDYHDWYLRSGGSVFGSANILPNVTVDGSYDISRESTVLAVDALSILREGEPWRPNPLIDDGTYRMASLGATWDTRESSTHPQLQWYGRVEVRRVTSNSLDPVSLPQSIRDPLPDSGYGETEGDLDLRAYFRLNPENRLQFRLLGGGYLSGDPLTIQRRRALGGGDPMSGYGFRDINCDRRRRTDPADEALCDREMAVQAEYHRALPIDVGTRIGSYTIAVHHPDLVVLADMGSAWLAGDSAGRVPTNRIQELREWRSDAGIGITTGELGLYFAKSLVDPVGVQVLFLFHARF